MSRLSFISPKYPDYPYVPKGSQLSSMIHPPICYFHINQHPLFILSSSSRGDSFLTAQIRRMWSIDGMPLPSCWRGIDSSQQIIFDLIGKVGNVWWRISNGSDGSFAKARRMINQLFSSSSIPPLILNIAQRRVCAVQRAMMSDLFADLFGFK
ncbi:hypothetical protein ALC56_13708 [Trachymyrmex septentrionalis]|uniref:Uncharacterized protein n=1 Tax=Trachymyrmex septentrionalis TaxID=34720 RepID=A0A195EUM2_9HYME|nr:hypothetical protein ALC56_13708 [Trachymyrmex septentrionalis]